MLKLSESVDFMGSLPDSITFQGGVKLLDAGFSYNLMQLSDSVYFMGPLDFSGSIAFRDH